MKSVQSRSIDDSRLMPNKHAFAVIEAVYHDCSCVAESDLIGRMLVLVPPFLSRFNV